jgi:hypothetical protein
MASWLYRTAARDAAKKLDYKTFRTYFDPINQLWRMKYIPGEPTIADWAKDKEWVAWTETDWEGSTEEKPGRKVGIAIVSITKAELDELLPTIELPKDFPVLFEYQSRELHEPEERLPKGRQPRQGGRTRATGESAPKGPREKSEAVSPVKIVWATADAMPGATRQDVIAACVAKGVHASTASTQYYRWAKAKKGGAL